MSAPRKASSKDAGTASKPAKRAPSKAQARSTHVDERPTLVASHGEPRRLTDAREMRALAHPLRVQLLEVLTREGPLTATEAAELVGESPANCSFHLRTLAKYGFVEEAPGGSGRSRPWRRTSLGISLSMADEDGEASVAAHTLAAMNQERVLQRLREWTIQESSAPAEWRTSAFADTFLMYLTPQELQGVEADIYAVVTKYHDRTLDLAKRPPEARPVSIAAFGHPIPPNPSGN